MNPQFTVQYYSSNTPQNKLTAEQMKLLKKQQDSFLEQQKKYYLQQQELQKQQMREEQRNRLKNMNVRTMGASSNLTPASTQPQQPQYNQGMFQQSSNQPYSYSVNYQPNQPGFSMPYNPVQPQQYNYPQLFPQPLGHTMNQPSAQLQPPAQHLPDTSSNFTSSNSSSSNVPLQPTIPFQNISSQPTLQPQPFSKSSNNTLISSDSHISTDDEFGDFEFVPSSQPNVSTQLINMPSETTVLPQSLSDVSVFDQGITSKPPVSTILNQAPEAADTWESSSVSHFFSSDEPVAQQSDKDDSFGDFATFTSSLNSVSPLSNVSVTSSSSFIPTSSCATTLSKFTSSTSANDVESSKSNKTINNNDGFFGDFGASRDQSPISEILNLTDTSKTQEDDFFGDFTSSRGSTPRPNSDYVPGKLDLHEDLTSPHSVEIYSNPAKSDQGINNSKSEFDKLIEKSLSGKASSSNPKSLFKPPAKKAMPSSKATFQQAKNSVNWSSLDLGSMFVSPASNTISQDLAGLDLYSTPSNVTDVTSFIIGCEQSDEDDFGDFTSENASSCKIINSLGSNVSSCSPIHKSNSAPFFDVSDLVGIVSQDESIFDVNDSAVGDKWCGFATDSEPMLITTDNQLLSVMSQLTKKQTSGKQASLKGSKHIDSLPSIYQDIVEFCNTPSDLIDVSKVYEVMVTPKFKLVMLQPLMNQCNMANTPTPNDLIQLIGIVGLKQKGFPTPSKYELDYTHMPIPSINSAAMKKKDKSGESGKKVGTLLSFVNANKLSSQPILQDPLHPNDNGLKAVFDFDKSTTVDVLSKPIISMDEASMEPKSDPKPSPKPYLGLPTVPMKTEINFFDIGDDSGDSTNNWSDFSTPSVFLNKPIISQPSSEFFESTLISSNFTSFDLSKAIDTISSENNASKTAASKAKIPAAAMDEPPPLSDDDDDDWADFAHPANKWAIDPDEIDESKLSVNRWGGETKIVTTKPTTEIAFVPDKDFSHIQTGIAELTEKVVPQPFSDEVVASPETDDSFEDFVDASASIEQSLPQEDSFANHHQDVTPPSRDMILPSPETSHPTKEGTFSPFDDFVETKTSKKDELFWDEPTTNDSPVMDFNLDKCKSFSPFNEFDSVKENSSDLDEFSDFHSTNDTRPKDQIANDATFSPFDEFGHGPEEIQKPDDPEEITPQKNPLALENLPKKSLDGFWNEMVGTLETEKKEPVVIPQKPVQSYNQILFKEPVTYDALKEDCGVTEDHSWNKCLSNALSTLRQCEKLLRRATDEDVLHEFIKCSKGKQYLLCCVEIYRVACRISVSDTSDDCLVEIYKEIKHIWTLLGEILDDQFDLPTIHDFNISRNSEVTDIVIDRICGVCLLDTGCENKSGILSYNGRNYHVACANFWLNTISPTLPNFNISKLLEPLM